MSKKWMVMLLVTTTLLSACSEEKAIETTAQAEGVSSETQFNDSDPQGLKDGLVSVDFYNELHRVLKSLSTYNIHKEYMDEFNKMSSLVKDRALLDEYKSKLNEHDVFLEGVFTIAETSEEVELQEHLNKYIYHTQASNEFLKQYTDDMDSMYRSLASDEHDKAGVSLDALINAMEKYELFPE